MTGRRIQPVILSGGTGTRLWPVSRESFPKQLWPLLSARTMIQETALRAHGPGFAPPIVVCNQEHRFLVAEQLREAGIEGARIVLEPVGRNSAPAIAAAAVLVAEADPKTVLWMMPADHAIADLAGMHRHLEEAAEIAAQGRVVLFGMRPTAPETGFGYIEVDAGTEAASARDVRRFIEKPDAATAAELADSGRHLWNSGMFVFTARTLERELEAHAPDVLAAVRRAVAGRTADLDFIRLEAGAFRACPSISLDHAVAERTDRAAVIPAAIGWSDVGSWEALWERATKDDRGNAAIGDAILENADNCYVRSGDGMLAAVVGLKDTVLVVTEDAVLAAHREHAQDVKALVDRLKRDGRAEASMHNRVYRPWGHYEALIRGDRFQVKRIVVKPGGQLSLQKHFHRAEHWVVVSGSAIVTRGEKRELLHENESVYIPLGEVHRLENPGRIPLALIEVQSGAYLGEDDIVRIEDTYGRS